MNATLTEDTTTTPPAATEDERKYVGRRMAITEERLHSALGWSRREATNIMQRGGAGTEPRVFVVEGKELHDLPHYPLHSPSGFEWGYHGSGPSELARCVLLHFCELAARPKTGTSWCEEVYVPETGEAIEWRVSYQRFKVDVIGQLPRERFELPATKVREWLQANYPDSVPS